LDDKISEALAVLEVFEIEDSAAGLLGGGDDEAFVPAKAISSLEKRK